MAYWKEPEGPQVAPEGRMHVRDRLTVMSEREDGLRGLPSGRHGAFLKALYAKYPTYPFPDQKCWCMKCFGVAR